MADLTKEDITKLVEDTVSKAAAERMAQAQEEGAKKLSDARQAGAKDVFEALRAVTAAPPGAKAGVGDPHNGKGLDFVRCAKAIVLGQKSGVPAAIMAKSLGMPEYISKALQEQTVVDGGALVPDQFSSDFIELLRAATVVLESGARVVDFKGSMSMGRQNSAATASYFGENQAASASQPGLGLLQLSAKKLMGFVPVSNDLLRNPSASAEALVRDDMVRVMALRRDLALIQGDGTQYTPKGILNWMNAANKNASAGSTLANKVADFTSAISLVEDANVAMLKCGWLIRPTVKWKLAGTLDGQGRFVFADQIAAGSLFGYSFKTTTQLPANGASTVLFGDFSELIFGQDTAMSVEAFSGASYVDAGSNQVNGVQADQTVFRAVERHDLIMRHDLAFAAITGINY